jgi:4-amino-4-deoxy-L-arabinose transferase-like glycosyltransferase
MDGIRRRTLVDLLVAVALGAAAFVLYVVTLAPTVLAGDGGEFQFVPYLLGVAHPTGYPLYTMLGWLWSHLLPVGDVAYRMNLFSAFWAALAVAFVYPAALSLLRQVLPSLSPSVRRLLGVLAAVTFAGTPTLWSQAIIAEVYGLHIFFVVLIFYLLFAWGEHRQRRSLYLAAFTFGLSLTHHSTTVLLVPAILVYVWLADRQVLRDWRMLLRVSMLLLLPLLLYLYIPLRAPHTPYLRLPLTDQRDLILYENTWSHFAYFVLGGPFGGSLDLSVDLGARLAMSWGFLRDEVGWLGVVLVLVGVVGLAVGRPATGSGRGAVKDSGGRWALLALTGLTYIVSVAFNLVYTIGDIFVMYIPTYLVVVLWLTVGVGTLAALFHRQRVASVGIVLAFFALPVWLALTHFASVDQSRNSGARARWETILAEPLPSDAVLVSNDRNNIMPMWYFQYVDGQRPDLLGLFPLVTPDYPTLGYVLDLALSTGRPVYLIKEMPGIEVKAEVEPAGSLWRVLGSAVTGEPAYPRDSRWGDAVILAGYDRLPRSPQPGEALEISLYWEALRPLDREVHTFVHLLDAEGQVVAKSDRQPGGVYYPTTVWRTGERLRDDHTLAVPVDAPEGAYSLLVGMYAFSDDGTLQPLGEPIIIGQVGVKGSASAEPVDIGQAVGVSFARQIELMGYEATQQEEDLAVALHWRCLQPPNADYTVFVHLLDADGRVVAQHDSQPKGGAYPTSVWDVGEVVEDVHVLSLPPDLVPGRYWLRVGLYLLETGERLPVEGDGDSIELGWIELGD